MAEFVNFEVGVEEDNNEEGNKVSDDSDLDSLHLLLTMKRQKMTLIFILSLTMLKLVLSKH